MGTVPQSVVVSMGLLQMCLRSQQPRQAATPYRTADLPFRQESPPPQASKHWQSPLPAELLQENDNPVSGAFRCKWGLPPGRAERAEFAGRYSSVPDQTEKTSNRPDLRPQLFTGDCFAGPFEQHGQDAQGLGLNFDWPSVTKQGARLCIELEIAELDSHTIPGTHV